MKINKATISTHAPAQGATYNHLLYHPPTLLFQPTLPHRERRNVPLKVVIKQNFNPRSRTGSDQPQQWTRTNYGISTHAPAQGATGLDWQNH